MNRGYHPLLEILYFAAAISFSVLFLHSVCLALSLLFGLWHMVLLGLAKKLSWILPLALVGALLNPLINHEGATILAYFPNGNPLTAESIWYGLAAACMLAGVLCHSVCASHVITSDKLMYVFGTLSPSLSLVFSMSLRFVPRFSAQLKKMQKAQKALGNTSRGKRFAHIKSGIHLILGMLTWSFENAADTADSMHARGFGLPGRTAYTNYRWSRRDLYALFALSGLIMTIVLGGSMGGYAVSYFPKMAQARLSAGLLLTDLLFFALPVMIEGWEERKWKKYKSNI